MKIKILISSIVIIAIAMLAACSQEKRLPEKELSQNDKNRKALRIIKTACFSCHTPEREIVGGRSGPPFHKIRQHYVDDGTTKEEFVSAISSFLKEPTKEKVKMKGAYKKFGLMPRMPLTQDDITMIAEFMYDNDFTAEQWSKSAKMADVSETGEAVDYKSLGKQIALSTKSVLGKNLMSAIKKGGSHSAVEFCNTRAIPLTDSMAIELNAKVKRVSDKPRNPNNKANVQELNYITDAKNQLGSGGEIKPHLFESDGKMIGYYPITTNEMCMQCHGKPDQDIDKLTQSKLAKKYPEDKATGYSPNELRGIWVIEMDKK